MTKTQQKILLTVLVLVFLFLVLRVTSTVFAQEAEPKLTEIQQLKADNHKLKIAVAQLQAQLNECSLNGERAVLTDEFMKSLGAKPGDTLDWNTLTIQKKGEGQ
jgi:hypothetical protein